MNTTAPHALKKRLLTLILSFAFLLTCLPAALAVDLNVDAGFYFKQSRGGTCTLASAAMMLRRRAYFGRAERLDERDREQCALQQHGPTALHTALTYKEMQVGYATLPSGLRKPKRQVLISAVGTAPGGHRPVRPQPAPCVCC